MIDTTVVKEKLNKVYSDYTQTYEKKLDESFRKKLLEVKPGEKAPGKNVFYYSADAESFDEYAADSKNKCRDIIGQELEKVRAKKTDAPSTDAVNYIMMLKEKKNPTMDDIQNALDRYGNNYPAYQAIRSIALDHEIRLPADDNILDVLDDGLSFILSRCDKMGRNDVMKEWGADARNAAFEQTLDMSIPDVSII